MGIEPMIKVLQTSPLATWVPGRNNSLKIAKKELFFKPSLSREAGQPPLQIIYQFVEQKRLPFRSLFISL
jgi:hypothetical protein